jgi:hypothetical protein
MEIQFEGCSRRMRARSLAEAFNRIDRAARKEISIKCVLRSAHTQENWSLIDTALTAGCTRGLEQSNHLRCLLGAVNGVTVTSAPAHYQFVSLKGLVSIAIQRD